MIYQNDTLRIVPFERSKHMTEEYRSWFHDPDVTRFNSHGLFPYTPAAMDAFVKTIEQGSDSKIVWAIEVYKKGPERNPTQEEIQQYPGLGSVADPQWIHIGNCSLQAMNWVNRSVEFALVLGRERGKGYGFQVCQWMTLHAFNHLNMNRVWTGTADINLAMRHVAEKLRMKLEGTFTDGMFLHGKFVNVVVYGIVKKEWEAIKLNESYL